MTGRPVAEPASAATVTPPARVRLLVNPTAGRGRAAYAAEKVATRLRSHGIGVEVAPPGWPAAGAPLAASTAVVAVGGDGTVHRALQAVAGKGVALGVVPTGSGNDLARFLGLARADAVTAADVVAAGQLRTLDAVRVGGRWYLSVLAAGFDAAVAARGPLLSRSLGARRYDAAVLAELPRLRARPYRLELDGRVVHQSATLVAVANLPAYGGGLRIAPAAAADDGLLDVVVAGPVSRAAALRLLGMVRRGTHLSHPAVTVARARTVTVAAPDVVAYADGEPVGPLPLTCTVVPGAVGVLAPPRPPVGT